MPPVTLVHPTTNASSPVKLFMITGHGDVYDHNLHYSLLPFVQLHMEEMKMRFPTGLMLADWNLEDPGSVSERDLLIVFEPIVELLPAIEKALKLIPRDNTSLVLYENPVAYSYRAWPVVPSFSERFGSVFSSAALLANGEGNFWIPLWNFARGIGDPNNEPEAVTRKELPPHREFCAVNPIRTGLNVSQERLRIYDWFATEGEKVHFFGLENVMKSEPARLWVEKYQGEIPFDSYPLRFKSKIGVFKNYQFVLVCENTFVEGYISEKLAEPLLALSIPVYFGYPHIERYLPNLFSGGAINGHAYPSLRTLLVDLKTMSASDYDRRIERLFATRDEYLSLTSRDKIWSFVLERFFALPYNEFSQIAILNKQIAERNKSDGARIEALKLFLQNFEACDDYPKRIRTLLFEQHRLPEGDFFA